jgi:hypothetical protein
VLAVGEGAKECQTCFRYRPRGEFELPMDDARRFEAKICRRCRVLLWDDPDDPFEREAVFMGDPLPEAPKPPA